MHMRVQRWMIVCLLVVCVGMIAIPAHPALAVITVNQTLTNNTPTDFQAGKFGLTGLAQSGGVQLVPLGILKQWIQSNTALCRPITGAGYAAFKDHLYVVGGFTRQGGIDQIVRNVCRTKVTDISGQLDPWETFPAEDLATVDAVYDLQAAAVPLPGDSSLGSLLVIGGRDSSRESVNKVFTARINSNGTLGAWVAQTGGSALPSPRSNYALTTYTHWLDNQHITSETYVYAIGGLDQNFTPFAEQSILRSKVTASGGLSAWENIGNIPMRSINGQPASCAADTGLIDARAVNFDVVTLNNSGQRVLVLMGGVKAVKSANSTLECPTAEEPSAEVFLGFIDENTGNLTWDPTLYTLPEPLNSMGAIGLNQLIYTSGGGSGSGQISTSTLLSSLINEDVSGDLQLPSYADGNFLKSTTAWPAAWARRGHGMVWVEINNRPIVYSMGGTDVSGTFKQDVVFGYLGKFEDVDETQAAYASPGLYLSPVYKMRGPGQITQMSWTSVVSSTQNADTDIQMEFRVGNTISEVLNNPNWITVDGDTGSDKFSVSGANVAPTTSPVGQYVQYRARLYTLTPQNKDGTPILRGPVSIRYTVDGYPSLFVESAQLPTIDGNSAVSLEATLRNDVPAGSSGNVLDADVESDGVFFVDMYVFPPGTTPTIPTRGADGSYDVGSSKAFAMVNKASLPKETSFDIPPEAWLANCSDPNLNCPAANWNLIFNRSGTWTVYLIVDSGNNVTEDDQIADPWELDNVYTMTVNSTFNGGRLMMPIVRRFTPTP